MRVLMRAVGLASIAVAVLAACSSGEGEASSAQELTPASYCTTVAPLWDTNAIPNYDDDLSGAERATAVADFRAALASLSQGVGLGALTQDQADLLAKGFGVYLSFYEDPSLADAEPGVVAEAAGLSVGEMTALTSSDNTQVEAAVQALSDYCTPSS